MDSSPMEYPEFVPFTADNVWNNFLEFAKQTPDADAYGVPVSPEEDLKWYSMLEGAQMTSQLAMGLMNLPGGSILNQNVVIMGRNCIEWDLTDSALMIARAVSVPIFTSIYAENLAFIMEQTNPVTICTQREFISKVWIQLAPDFFSTVHSLVLLDGTVDDLSDQERELIAQWDVQVTSVSELIANNQEIEGDPTDDFCRENGILKCESKQDDVLTIIYSSGTTGKPKGVVADHRAFGTSIMGFRTRIHVGCHPVICFSYLPMSHIFARVTSHLCRTLGGGMGYFSGDKTRLVDEIGRCRPSMFIGVPKVYGTIAKKIKHRIETSGRITKAIFRRAYSAKAQAFRESGCTQWTHWMYDRLVFNKLRNMLGGRLQQFIAGAAPMAPEDAEFMQLCFCTYMTEGYGMTELMAHCTSQIYPSISLANVGTPCPNVEAKLIDVPEKNFIISEQPLGEPAEDWHWDAGEELKDYVGKMGELVVRSPTMMRGYYNDPELTASVITSDGYYKTGDIATVLPSGLIKVVSRTKETFKTAQGEFIVPQRIEACLHGCELVENVVVLGSHTSSFLVAIVVLSDRETWSPHNLSLPEDTTDPILKEAVLTQFQRLSFQSGLRPFEFVRDIFIAPAPFDTETGTMTPSAKVCRPVVERLFKAEVNQMLCVSDAPSLIVDIEELKREFNQ